jgi:D-beta-D-heptose 7-phosphate kinase/D-beta-D-heptose 1-phosphate adenosyltransferase
LVSEKAMRAGEMSKAKILDKTKLKNIIKELKKQDKKIVFTNGCFDIIHIGHVRYLEEAKKLGDILIIGLNSDKSVSKIKSGRPIIPEEQRAEVLSALYMIDYMTLFDEDTPYQLIKDLQPDILVKGADWGKNDIVGNDIVKEVHTIPFVEGISTSEIIERAKNL